MQHYIIISWSGSKKISVSQILSTFTGGKYITAFSFLREETRSFFSYSLLIHKILVQIYSVMFHSFPQFLIKWELMLGHGKPAPHLSLILLQRDPYWASCSELHWNKCSHYSARSLVFVKDDLFFLQVAATLSDSGSLNCFLFMVVIGKSITIFMRVQKFTLN